MNQYILKTKISYACNADQSQTDAGKAARAMTLAEALEALNYLIIAYNA